MSHRAFHRSAPLRSAPLVLLLALTLLAAWPVQATAAEGGDAASSVEARNTQLALEFIQEVYLDRDFDKIPDYIAEDFVDHSPGAPPDARGPDFVRRQAEATLASFPDFRFEKRHTVAEGDLVAIHWTMTGTSTEAVAGPGGAGKAVAVDGISLFRYDDEGKVAESWDLVDRAGMLTQLGFQIRPPAAQSSD